MKKIIILIVAVAFVFGALGVSFADPKEDACKALKGNVDTAVKAYDDAKGAYDTTCGKSAMIPGCKNLKTALKDTKKGKEDAEKAFKDQCGK